MTSVNGSPGGDRPREQHGADAHRARGEGPLYGVRVLDLIEGGPGAFASKLFVQLGAEVVKVEPPGGDPLRADAPFLREQPGEDRSLRWHHYRGGTQSIVLDLAGEPRDREILLNLAAGADVLIENLPVGRLHEAGLGVEQLLAANPRLVVTSVTPFGQDGPRSTWAGSDIVGYATGGMMSLTGEPTEPPVRLGGGQADQLAGMYATLGTLCALNHSSCTGRGQHVDVSIQEAVAGSIADAGVTFYQFNDGMNPERVGTEHPVVVPVFASPSKDGHLLIDCLEAHQFKGLVAWAREAGAYVEPLEGPELDVAMNRLPLRDLINTLIGEATASFSKAEMYAPMQARKVPCGPVSSMPDLDANPQLQARELFVPLRLDDGVEAKSARSPFGFSRCGAPAPARAPRLDEHRSAVLDGVRPRPHAQPRHVIRSGRAGSDAPRALDGVRIIDFSWALAGPWTSRMLAHEGAEVIRVESETRLDALRQMGPDRERAGAFINANAGKLGVALDMLDERGAEIARALAASADVVVDNFRPGVMEKLGLDHERLAEANPRIITCSMPAQGSTGPHREYVAYGPVLHALAGFTYLTGYPNSVPSAICTGFVDQLAAGHAAIAILAALRHRDLTGDGQHVEIAQLEAAIGMLDSTALEYFANGVVRTRQGNRDDNAAPHGCYRCAGEDQWVAIAVATDAQWRQLARAVGSPDLAEDPALAGLSGRLARHDQLDELIGAWTRGREASTVMEELQAVGVPAGKVQRVGDLLDGDPHLDARRFYELTHHPVMGEVWLDGGAFRLRDTPGSLLGRAGPTMGQDTRELLRELVGVGEDELDLLAARGAVFCQPATEPAG